MSGGMKKNGSIANKASIRKCQFRILVWDYGCLLYNSLNFSVCLKVSEYKRLGRSSSQDAEDTQPGLGTAVLNHWWRARARWEQELEKEKNLTLEKAGLLFSKSSQGYGFPSGHVWMWELDYKESWAQKNSCFWTVVLKTLESPLDCKEIQPVHPKGNQSWIFIGRTDAEAETPVLWPTDGKNWLIRKDPDAGKDWRREEKGTMEDELVGWHHWLNGHEFE